MSESRTSPQFAEAYINRCYMGNEAVRWWAHPLILVGGSICDVGDCEHLQRDFGVQSVISVETEHDDAGKIVAGVPAFRVPFPDDGSAVPIETWAAIAAASACAITHPRLYVHCQQGGSRSPAVAYFIMRHRLGMTREGALLNIRGFKTDYGQHPYHQSYIAAAEAAIAKGMPI